MIVGVIGSGSIGPDLAYGFASSLAKDPTSKVFLLDIEREALERGLARIRGYMEKGVSRGKLSPKAAKAIASALVTTEKMADWANCDYVLEAATEDLALKRQILRQLEDVVSSACLIGFATSGIPRAQLAAEARHPARCFVNHPFYPAWRSKPVEVVLSEDAALAGRMLGTLQQLGKVPIVTADVPCFAADDIFVNYCAEAARLVAEGVANPAQVDRIVHQAIGGGGPFNVMDLTRGNLLNVKCLELLRQADHGSDQFDPPPIFRQRGSQLWHDPRQPHDPNHDAALARTVLDRILAVLFSRTYFVVERGICSPSDLNWLTQNALGFRQGLLDLAEERGADELARLCEGYAVGHTGFFVPACVVRRELPRFYRNVTVVRGDDRVALVTVRRPEAMNALSDQTIEELKLVFRELAADNEIVGLVLTGFGGPLAGADITELAQLKTSAEAVAKCQRCHELLSFVEGMVKPVIAAVDGPVLGGGAELSMGCHARVVGPNLMLGQPEVNLGIIPGFGGTQRLPRLVGLERGFEMLRTGRPIGAKEACALGWATGEPTRDPVEKARTLIAAHLRGEKLPTTNRGPMDVPQTLPVVDLGHHSLAVDAILVDVLRRGLRLTLTEGLAVEAEAFGRCKALVDFEIGMKNFMQNGPRIQAAFLHE
jgi:enoyl-CoA hydratase/3-hydroxyacyl-CoA dehydrogenase